MGLFLSWNEWLALKESNARKRAVAAATKRLAPVMPGSTAACPSTNPIAMKQAKKHGVVGITEEKKSPNYSFDQWIKKVQKLGDDIKQTVDQGKEQEKELDKNKEKIDQDIDKAEKSKKSEKSESPEKSEKETESKEGKPSDKNSHEDSWNKISHKLNQTKAKKTSTKKSTKPIKNSGQQ